MPAARDDLTGSALATFGARWVGGTPAADARSGAAVHRVRLRGGAAAHLKVAARSAAADSCEVVAAAERELRFYRDVAPTAPVRTPPLLDSFRTEDGVALLLGDAGVQRDVTAWAPHPWGVLGRDLARLHAMPVPVGVWDRPDSLLAALEDPDTGGVVAFWSGHLPQLDRYLGCRDLLRDRFACAPTVFVHGDCHTANVLHDEATRDEAQRSAEAGDTSRNRLVLCDWQQAGIGRPASDLALLSVRAAPSGTRVPDVMFAQYLRQSARDGAAHDAAELRRDVLLEELAILIFQWPPFAAYNDAVGIERVRRRARHVAGLLSSPRPGRAADVLPDQD